MKKYLFKKASLIILILLSLACSPKNNAEINSPNENLKVLVSLSETGCPMYAVSYLNKPIILKSKLGVVRLDADFTKDLTLVSESESEEIKETYKMHYGKRSVCSYIGNRRTFHYKNKSGDEIDIIFQVSDDGLAFRYEFQEASAELKKITKEATSFRFDTSAIGFLQACPDSKTGWSQTQPSYEEHYNQGNKVGKSSPFSAGWVFPALYQIENIWVLISESDLDRNYCASRLSQHSPMGEYSIQFPQATEGVLGGAVLPESTLPWKTPWRIITIGDGLAPIMESTLGTDLNTPEKFNVDSFYQPGKASWSWVILKDESVVFNVQKEFIDYASEMNWQYCLVDGLWDKTIGFDKIKELADYAKTKNVGLILWYNSAGDWNTAYQTPKNKMLTKESREQEFKKIHEIGIKGIKVDFFAGDGQSTIAYYQDILEAAAKYEILVNFHGCTLPRGWQRTYPNLVTMESVRGFEMVTFGQENADVQPNHCCMLPFTRNVFDPMDFTPMCFSQVPNIERKTTKGFELALSVLFLSGIQHYAEIPAGMKNQPEYVRDFLKTLPNTWDDVKFIDGYPGKFVVLARKSGNKWYVCGINGQDKVKTLKINLDFLIEGEHSVQIIKDGIDSNGFELQKSIVRKGNVIEVNLLGNGGFTAEIE